MEQKLRMKLIWFSGCVRLMWNLILMYSWTDMYPGRLEWLTVTRMGMMSGGVGVVDVSFNKSRSSCLGIPLGDLQDWVAYTCTYLKLSILTLPPLTDLSTFLHDITSCWPVTAWLSYCHKQLHFTQSRKNRPFIVWISNSWVTWALWITSVSNELLHFPSVIQTVLSQVPGQQCLELIISWISRHSRFLSS